MQICDLLAKVRSANTFCLFFIILLLFRLVHARLVYYVDENDVHIYRTPQSLKAFIQDHNIISIAALQFPYRRLLSDGTCSPYSIKRVPASDIQSIRSIGIKGYSCIYFHLIIRAKNHVLFG